MSGFDRAITSAPIQDIDAFQRRLEQNLGMGVRHLRKRSTADGGSAEEDGNNRRNPSAATQKAPSLRPLAFFEDVNAGSLATSTAMILPRLAPGTSAGNEFIMPPSTCTSFPMITGGNSPGIDMLARSASTSDPSRCTANVPVVKFAETQKNGRHRSSMRRPPKFCASSRATFAPLTKERNGNV